MTWQAPPDESEQTATSPDGAVAGLTVFMTVVLVLAGLALGSVGVLEYSWAAHVAGELDAAAAAKIASGFELQQLGVARVHLYAVYGLILLLPVMLLGAAVVWRFGPRASDSQKLAERLGPDGARLIRVIEAGAFLFIVILAGTFACGVDAGIKSRLGPTPLLGANIESRLKHRDDYRQAGVSKNQVEILVRLIETSAGDTQKRALLDLAAEVKTERFRSISTSMRDNLRTSIHMALDRTRIDQEQRGAMRELLAALDPSAAPPAPSAPQPAPPVATQAPAVAAPEPINVRLHKAVLDHDLAALNQLTRSGCNLNTPDPEGTTPLFAAIQRERARRRTAPLRALV